MVALNRVGIPVNRYVAYEIDKYAIQVSQNNYPQIEHCGDVTAADFTQYKGFDLLIGGSPCTYWSIAKKDRETTCDGIGFQLFMQYIRAWKESEIPYFLYENNFSIHKDIKAEISKRFGVSEIMINSALVSAQQRKRCYWTNIPNVKQPNDKGILLKDILESGIPYQEKSYCMTANYDSAVLWNSLERSQRSMVAEPVIFQRPHGFNQGGIKTGKAPTITANGSYFDNNHIVEPICVAQRGRYIESGSRSKKCDGGTYQAFEARSDGKSNCVTTVQKDCLIAEPIRIGQIGKGGQRIYSVKGKSVTLSANGRGQGAKTGLYKIDLPDGDYIIRKLTPIEAERLQTLPDNYTFGISNTQRYKCIGNGWTVDVIAHILKNLKGEDI